MLINAQEKLLYLKVVYYGPGVCGKTTNLQTLHRLTDPDRDNQLVSLKTKGDRTLFFDLLPFDLGTLNDLSVQIKVYTVPGQIQYDTTRKQVLAGADAVVFVADSQVRQEPENVRMLQYLKNNLRDNGMDMDAIPLIMQWNKRDLPDILPAETMERDLNFRGVPAFQAVATVGTGVIETFEAAVVATIDHLAESNPAIGSSLGGKSPAELVAASLDRFRIDASPEPAASPADLGITTGLDAYQRHDARNRDKKVLGLDDLLASAVASNQEMAEKLADHKELDRKLDRLEREREAMAELSRTLASTRSADEVYAALLRTALRGTGLRCGSVLAPGAPGAALETRACLGRPEDPLNAVEIPGVGTLAGSLADRGAPLLSRDLSADLLFGQPHAGLEGVRGLVAAPVRCWDTGLGVLLLYEESQDRELVEEDLGLVAMVAAAGAPAIMALLLARKVSAARKSA